MNPVASNVSGSIPRGGVDADGGWQGVVWDDSTTQHLHLPATATTSLPFLSHAPPASVYKARAMLDQLAAANAAASVVAANPEYSVDPELEVSALSVGEIADLCRLQSIEFANQQQQQQGERDEDQRRVRQQPQQQQQQHDDYRHRSVYDDKGYHHDTNDSKTFYYEPLNPSKMLSADKLPAMEEARLDIQMKKLYDGLYPYGGTTGVGTEAGPTRKW
jgi:hypothetical protein